MSRKNIILIIIAVVVIGIAGYIFYRGFYGQPSAPLLAQPPVGALTPTPTPTAASTATDDSGALVPVPVTVTSGEILPLGTSLDLSLVKKYNADGKLFSYPKVDPAEVSPVLTDIVTKAP